MQMVPTHWDLQNRWDAECLCSRVANNLLQEFSLLGFIKVPQIQRQCLREMALHGDLQDCLTLTQIKQVSRFRC